MNKAERGTTLCRNSEERCSAEALREVALAWLLAKKVVSSIIIGASRPSQLDDNMGAADLVLTTDELAELDGFTQPAPVYPNWFGQMTLDPAVKAALTRP